METNAMQLDAIEDRCPDCGSPLDVHDEGAELVLECDCGTAAALA